MVVGMELIEIIVSEGSARGFAVHYEEGTVVVDDAIEMATENVWLTYRPFCIYITWLEIWPPIKLEAEAGFQSGLSII